MAHRTEFNQEEWNTTDPRTFRALTDHPPPRPWGYWDQIRVDLKSWAVIRMWVTGVGLAIVAAVIAAAALENEEWWYLPLAGYLLYRGLRFLFLWVRLARIVVTSIRANPVATGVVHRFEPHPLLPGLLAVGQAVRPNGETVDVGILEEYAHAAEQDWLPTEVYFIDDPTAQYRSVFAVRPIASRKPSA